ncbi:MAG: HEAT repeat domain-containing protein [Candidatus Omnitrophica bacterium]|nr:HEAT repeat domain-containing protein [Candidatus Omnitrophota bacterium]
MPTKNTREFLQECEKQADSLFITFGRLLYENIQAGAIAYYFEPDNPKLTVVAKRLIRDVVAEKISDRKEKREPLSVAKSEPLPKFKVSESLPINCVGEADVSFAPAPVSQEQRPSGISRRGQFEPYTKLNVALRVAENKILDVQKDLSDCLSAGLMHTTGERTAAYQAAVDEKIQKITFLMAQKREEIKRIMENKKKFFADNPEVAMWKAEESFLEQIRLEVNETTRRVDDLIDEVIVLFKNINDVYEKDLELARIDRQGSFRPVTQPLEPPVPLPEYPEDLAEEVSGETQEEVLSEQQEVVENGNDEELEDQGDYGLLETASRKLGNESTSDDDKLAVLHTLFRNAPKRAVPFLYELTREADIFFQRKLISLLGTLDYPTMVDVYRRFINDENSSLRLQGMMGLVKLGSEEAKHVIVSAIRDPDAHIRRFIVNHLDHRAGGPEAEAIARLSGDSDEGVARLAIRKLGIMANHFAFVTLVPKLESVNIKVCKETIEALMAITGTDKGYDYSAPLPERKRQARVWKAIAKESYTKPRLLRDLQRESAAGNKLGQKAVLPAENKRRK